MLKINDKLKGKEFLIDVYTVIQRNPQLDRDFFALNSIIKKMYCFDKDLANQWTIQLLNQYTSQGIIDYKNKFSENSDLVSFLEELIFIFCQNNSYQVIVQLIHDKISMYQGRFFIWKFVINNEDFKTYFFQLLDHDLKQDRYDTIQRIILNIIETQGYIEEGLFDITDFLASIIEHVIQKDYMKQKQLNFIYSLINLAINTFDKAYLKTYFLDFI